MNTNKYNKGYLIRHDGTASRLIVIPAYICLVISYDTDLVFCLCIYTFNKFNSIQARKITEEIRIGKINEQWAGIPREQLLNQSFNDQLNSIQILEQLAPLQLAKDHLPGDIIDILERLGKVDIIPHNQLYYVAEYCADRYYSKVIETFVLLLK